MTDKKIILKRKKEESLLRRHPWVFSGAIERSEGDPEEGDVVDVLTCEGEFIARGHCQIGSIAVRVLTFEREEIDAGWWLRRMEAAYRLRLALGLADSGETDDTGSNDTSGGTDSANETGSAATSGDTTCYRLIHGEGDSLPGLVVDIYGQVAVVQCHSVGMFLARAEVADALRTLYGQRLKAVYDKSSQTVPFNAGLDAVDGYLWGDAPAAGYEVLEDGNRFVVNWERGQKTGFFIDQRENRKLVGRYAAGRRVLNTFCYTGGFSVYALAAGARSVDSVDSSQHAVELADRNAKLNFGPEAPHRAIACDAMDFLRDTTESYDMIILDPPAFAKHHKVLGNALKGYRRLNARALEKIAPGGILFTFSCSQAVSREAFRTTVFSAAAQSGRNVRILHQLTQPADHPVNIYHPESEYLKGLVLYVE